MSGERPPLLTHSLHSLQWIHSQELLYESVCLTSIPSLELFTQTIARTHLGALVTDLHICLPVALKSSHTPLVRHYSMQGAVLCHVEKKRSQAAAPVPKATLAILYASLHRLRKLNIAGQMLGDVAQPLRVAAFGQTLRSFTLTDAILSPHCVPLREISAHLPQLETFHLLEWKEEKLDIFVPVEEDLSQAFASLGLGHSKKSSGAREIKSLHMRRFQWSSQAMEREFKYCEKSSLLELRLLLPSTALDWVKYISKAGEKLERLGLDLLGRLLSDGCSLVLLMC